MAAGTSQKQLQELLDGLRDRPVNSEECSEATLKTIYDYIVSRPLNRSDKLLHWFCDRAGPTTIAAASFSLRLFAYSSGEVAIWKNTFRKCVSKCPDCVRGLEVAKVESRKTYFAAFDDDIKNGFYFSFAQWELESILEELTNAGILSSTGTPTSKPLSNVPPAIVYNMVSNITVLRDRRILSAIMAAPLSEPLPGWPTDPIPPGLLILLLNKNEKVRQWALRHTSICRTVPIATEAFSESYKLVLEAMVPAFSANTHVPHPNPNEAIQTTIVADPNILWQSFKEVMRFIPSRFLTCSSSLAVDIRRMVTGHLHDTGAFPIILDCFNVLLKRLSDELWNGESPEYPQVVFDSIKDNPSFLNLIQSTDPLRENFQPLGWFGAYIDTLRGKPVYSEVLAKMADFMCEELQHERFKDTRPVIMVSAVKLLKSQSKHDTEQGRAVSNVLGIHADVLVSVAFGRACIGPQWGTARSAARDLIRHILAEDVKNLCAGILQLCQATSRLARRSESDHSVSTITLQEQFWKSTYASLQSNDSDGMVTIITIGALASHLDTAHLKAFTLPDSSTPYPPGAQKTLADAVSQINKCQEIIRDGFVETFSKYTDYNTPSSVVDMLRRPGVVKDLTKLMFSPVENFQIAAQSLVGLAYDVDGRLDCFRALLENFLDGALDGVLEFLPIFIDYATGVPEACSLSKSVVRCLTDIIEVLCTTPNGILHNKILLRPKDDQGPASVLPKLWNLMTKALIIIFKRTPSWSSYFDNKVMVEWMRDVLIFGRDMLAQRQVIETAANSRYKDSERKPGKLTAIGKKMIDDLQETLLELTRWLRLTDEELLHQSFSFLQSLLDCFRENGTRPSKPGMDKLLKHIKDARDSKTRLGPSQLNKLEAALASFDDDDEVEIVSYIPAPEKAKSKTADTSKPKQTKIAVEPVSRKTIGKVPVKAVLPATSSKPTKSTFFNEKDQRKLDSAPSLPSFRKSSAGQPTAGPSKSSAAKLPDAVRRVEGPVKGTSSDESSESEEDESQGGLASLAKKQTTPKIKKQHIRPSVKLMEDPALQRAMAEKRRRREEGQRYLRKVKPDFTRLYTTLLSWDYNYVGPTPPDPSLKFMNVPERFRDYQHYLQVFEPLLFLECWEQIVQSRQIKDTQDSIEGRIQARAYIDHCWLDLDLTSSQQIRQGWYLADTDIVLLQNPDGTKCILGKTKSYNTPRGDKSDDKSVSAQFTIRCLITPGHADPGLNLGTTWRICKVMSLSTLHREYAALLALQYYDFCDDILHASLAKPQKIDAADIKQTMVDHGVNEPQAVAIKSALHTRGFGLIQGPPGTGKTSTICGLIAAFLSNRPRPAVNIFPGRSETATPRKILVCAPSNAAIDEVASRIKDGFRGPNRPAGAAKVVRIGADSAISLSVKDISLDALVDQKLQAQERPSNDTASNVTALYSELAAIKEQRQRMQQELDTVRDNTARTLAIQEELKRLNARRMTASQRLDHAKDKRKSESRSADAARRKCRLDVVQEADVVCSTLSGAGQDILETFDFEMVIIDEAAQAIELSSLIPLKNTCTRCIMVGDPQQLPPTVLSQEACKYKYNQSLFVRLQKQRPDAVHLLSIQYRMHPEISRLPSNLFYGGLLHDGPNMEEKTKQPWHKSPRFGIYRFFNLPRAVEQSVGTSAKNTAEAQLAVALYSRLRQEFSGIDLDFRVGVVTMYKAQITELRRQFEQRFGASIIGKVDFNTVDGFQGQEKDIIILSCVRAGPGLTSVGFLSDVRRMNVALTRAKSSLFILGNAATLERSNRDWSQIVQDARSRNALTDIDNTYFTGPLSSTTMSTPPRPVASRKLGQTASSAVLPADLATPKNLKASITAASQPKLGKKASGAELAQRITAETPVQNQLKRNIDDVENAPNRQAQPPPRAGPSIPPGLPPKPPQSNAAPPPNKRRKKGKPDIFIRNNKNNNNKRPPDDDRGGPTKRLKS